MSDPFDFIGGILLGTLLGSLATLLYHVRQIHHETRQNYIRLSLAHAEVVTLERTLEFQRSGSSTQAVQATPTSQPMGSTSFDNGPETIHVV